MQAQKTKYHDIYLAPGLKKKIRNRRETFDTVYASSSSVNMLNASQISPQARVRSSRLNDIRAEAYLFEDSDDIVFKSIDLFYKRAQVTQSIGLGADIGLFSIAQREKKYSGMRYGGTIYYNNFSLRLGMNDYDDFSEFTPTLMYSNRYKKHSYSLEYTRQNALFYTYSLITYEKRIKADHFSLSDYIAFENKTDLWLNAEVNLFSNHDLEFTAQFDWVFYKDTLFTPKFTYDFALEGWYTSHSKQHNDFYSPVFSDSTLIRFDPQYIFSKYIGLKGKIGLGYSVVDENIPYKYGIWVFGQPLANLSYKIGCQWNNAARISYGGSYHYKECKASLGYTW